MRILVLNANSLVKLTINNILKFAEDTDAVFAGWNDGDFDDLIRDK